VRTRFCTPRQRRELVRWLQFALIAMAVTGATAILAGMLASFFFS
jgi:hypothetical protein